MGRVMSTVIAISTEARILHSPLICEAGSFTSDPPTDGRVIQRGHLLIRPPHLHKSLVADHTIPVSLCNVIKWGDTSE